MANFIEKLFRIDQRVTKHYEKQATKVLAFEEAMHKLTDDELRAKTPYFKEQLKQGKTLEDIKYEAMAVAREAARRTLGQFPFKVQVMGALVLHDGDVAEMRTGEGKTSSAGRRHHAAPRDLQRHQKGRGTSVQAGAEGRDCRDSRKTGPCGKYCACMRNERSRSPDDRPLRPWDLYSLDL